MLENIVLNIYVETNLLILGNFLVNNSWQVRQLKTCFAQKAQNYHF